MAERTETFATILLFIEYETLQKQRLCSFSTNKHIDHLQVLWTENSRLGTSNHVHQYRR